ncbi:CRISPR-associated protein [Dehalococcoides mccartyi]|uniref:pre-crRNA processing endonuclease n=1 Tax=Dehalococcoides mccartyi TaxID=61435 RepID=A0A0V8M5I2_9CHLR|nr:type I-C CRISPR-associated protein Cas5c [Dehalococcoides mccartyi]KSV18987.1 CRISPR-associated protein [Dehalococcoides mccartyi]
MEKKIDFLLYGKYALFTDPVTKIGGEKCSYHLPTYEAIKGIARSIYWKPTLIWVIDRVRVMKPIKTQSKNIKTLKYNDGSSDLSVYSYLWDVAYQVQARMEWNTQRPDLACDRIDAKHLSMAQQSLKKGGRQDIFLGTRECQGYVEPCVYGEGEGYYDQIPELTFGLMFRNFDYPSETGIEEFRSCFWRPVMKNGEVVFNPRDSSIVSRFIRKMKPFYPQLSPEEDGGRTVCYNCKEDCNLRQPAPGGGLP